MHTFRKNVQPKDLTRAKVIGITLATPGDKEGPIHRVTLDMKGRVTHQENTPEWGKAFLTFPPAFKDLSAIAKWSFSLLEDCYGYGDIIEQRICVLELYTHKEISTNLDKKMFEDIKEDLHERMSHYTNSRQPTNDEVRLAWLVAEMEELHRQLEKCPPIKSSVSINSYPSNYVEEEMPQIIVEVRYKKDYNPSDEVRKEKAETIANKIETFINKIL